MQSTLRAIADHPALHLDIIATGMHLLPKFGRTLSSIMSAGWPIAARVRMQRGDGASLDQARGLGLGIGGLARAFEALKCELVLVVGDRIEAMAGALAAVTTGRCVAHVHGGDVAAGDFDDAIRHSITKLAHVHLAATRESAERIVRMGEDRRRVHMVGAPAMDDLFAIAREVRSTTAGNRTKQVALVVQHATGRKDEYERQVMNEILRAVVEHGLHPQIIYPNTDRGNRGVIAAIEDFRRRGNFAGRANAKKVGAPAFLRIERSLPREEFLRALRDCALLVGNSSAGIIEAPMIGTPSVNVGDRQSGRQRGGSCVIDCAEQREPIYEAIAKALRMRRQRGRVYGDGRTGPRIASILARVELGEEFLRKRITY